MPAILGFSAVMKNLSTVADTSAVPTVIVSAVAVNMAVSLFLLGGVLDRLARDRTLGAGAFFSACGTYFVRFLRLSIITGFVYWLLFVPFHGWMFDELYPALAENITVERTAFLIRVGLYVAFALPVFAFNILFDYAKIRAVVEDRRSMLGAIGASWRFIKRQPVAVLALYKINALLFLGVIGFYYLAAPGGSANLSAFAIGQLYIVLRVIVRLQFAA